MLLHTHTHTHTHTRLTALCPGLPEWAAGKWVAVAPADHMQVCTSLQADNHASTHHSVFCRPDARPAAQPTASKHWRQPYVATLPCETLSSAKQAINNKLQGIVATYLKCGVVVNNQIKKGLLPSLWVKFFLNRWTFGKVTTKTVIVSCTFCLLAVCWPTLYMAWTPLPQFLVDVLYSLLYSSFTTTTALLHNTRLTASFPRQPR